MLGQLTRSHQAEAVRAGYSAAGAHGPGSLPMPAAGEPPHVRLEGETLMTVQADTAPPSAVDEFLNRPVTLGQRVQHVLHKQPALSPAIVLVLSCLIFSLLSSRFYTPDNCHSSCSRWPSSVR